MELGDKYIGLVFSSRKQMDNSQIYSEKEKKSINHLLLRFWGISSSCAFIMSLHFTIMTLFLKHNPLCVNHISTPNFGPKYDEEHLSSDKEAITRLQR